MDKGPEETEDNAEDAKADADAVEDGVEDEAHLHKRRRTTTYLRLAGRSPHYSVEEQAYSMPRTLSNGTIIGIIVSRAASTWKMDTHLQHAHRIGENRGTRRGAPDRTYSSTLQQDTLHPSKGSTRISCLRGSDR